MKQDIQFKKLPLESSRYSVLLNGKPTGVSVQSHFASFGAARLIWTATDSKTGKTTHSATRAQAAKSLLGKLGSL